MRKHVLVCLMMAVVLTLCSIMGALAQDDSFALSESALTLMKGEKALLTASFQGGDLDAKAKLTWNTSDAKVVKVNQGKVQAAGAGTATVSCDFNNGTTDYHAECTVTVTVAVKSISASQKKITLAVGASYVPEVKVTPADATNTLLMWTSADDQIVMVDERGRLTAVGAGSCDVTAVSTDGSDKSTVISVFVPTLAAESTDVSITEKTGGTFDVVYYGDNADALVCKASGQAAEISQPMLSGTTLSFNVVPLKAGKVTLSITDPNSKGSSVKITVNVEHSAVYDSVSYPKISYKDAYRYPDQYEGQQVSFSGRVLQVVDGTNEVDLRVATKGRWDNIAYVVVEKNASYVNILEEDKVTIYGTYSGNYTYTTIMGGSVTIPLILCERIILK